MLQWKSSHGTSFLLKKQIAKPRLMYFHVIAIVGVNTVTLPNDKGTGITLLGFGKGLRGNYWTNFLLLENLTVLPNGWLPRAFPRATLPKLLQLATHRRPRS